MICWAISSMEPRPLLLAFLVVLFDTAFGGTPVFSAPTENHDFQFAEGASGREVTTVAATDDPNTITYSIVSQTPTHNPPFFSIDQDTGILSTATEIDYEAITGTKITTLVVQALSSAGPTDTASVSFTVTITDINDHTPTFGTVVFCQAIQSNSSAGTTVGIYTATDGDGTAAHNTISSYTITGGDDNPNSFAVDNAGEITTMGQSFAQTKYELIITASDGTNVGTGTATVPIDGSCDGSNGGGDGNGGSNNNGGGDGNGASVNRVAMSVAIISMLTGLQAVQQINID